MGFPAFAFLRRIPGPSPVPPPSAPHFPMGKLTVPGEQLRFCLAAGKLRARWQANKIPVPAPEVQGGTVGSGVAAPAPRLDALGVTGICPQA